MRTLRRAILLSGMAAAACLSLPSPVLAEPDAPAAHAVRPNVVIILADDLGYADLSSYGRRDYRTPNIDRLASEGVRFTQAYANSAVCSPSRVALITGRYQYRLPVGLDEPLGGREDLGLEPDVPTLPSMLKADGYQTALIGKWHMGPPPSHGPLSSGYDRFFGIYGGATNYFTHSMGFGGRDWGALVDQDREISRPGYVTDIFGDAAAQWIDKAATDKAPYLLSLHFTAPHWPWQGPEDEAGANNISKPMHPDGGSLETFAAMVGSLDDNVGKVLDAIERSGEADNTIVIFTSDNGGERFSDTWPLIGMKTELTEGGLRVPLLIRWPGQIAPGTTSDQIAIGMDLVPTILDASGSDAAKDYKSDGIDLLPSLTGGATDNARALFWRYASQDQRAARIGDWKYFDIAGHEFLFDLSADVHERANLKDIYPDKLDKMKKMYAEWNSTMLPYGKDNTSHNVKADNLADRY